MTDPQQRSLFGKLLEEYRVRRGVRTQAELSRLLAEKGYRIHVSTVNKYESGERQPPPMFIPVVARCLGLNEDQRDTLFNGLITDITLKMIEEYREAVAKDEETNITGDCA